MTTFFRFACPDDNGEVIVSKSGLAICDSCGWKSDYSQTVKTPYKEKRMKKYISGEEFAMRAKVSRPTVRKLFAAGKLKGAYRIANRWLQIPEEYVAFYLKEENRPRIGRPAAKAASKKAAKPASKKAAKPASKKAAKPASKKAAKPAVKKAAKKAAKPAVKKAAKTAAKPAAITGPFIAENVVIEQSE